MKQIIFVLALLMSFSSATPTAQANAPLFAGVSISIDAPSPTKTANPTVKKEKLGWLKKAALSIAKKVADMDQTTLLFVILAAVIGALGIHRVVAGAKPVIILWYILVALGISLIYTLLSIVTGGLFALFGWSLYWILPLFDIIKVFTKGIGHFQGNNDVFAGFK